MTYFAAATALHWGGKSLIFSFGFGFDEPV